MEFVTACAGSVGLRQNELELAQPFKHAPGSKLHRFARLLSRKSNICYNERDYFSASCAFLYCAMISCWTLAGTSSYW